MLKSINLSLSSLCGADCIFCPNGAKKAGRQKSMPFSLAEKIIDEISSAKFAVNHRISRISIGENGDVFINKELFEILRYMRAKLPEVSVVCYTNFQHFTPEKARFILAENLVNEFVCNVDGCSEENYRGVKSLNLPEVKSNILAFLRIRKELGSAAPLHLQVLTLHAYVNAVRHYLGVLPAKLNSGRALPDRLKDDFLEVKEQWGPELDRTKDSITKIVSLFLWAEREQVDTKKLDYKDYACPMLQVIREQAFISPEGIWYACCYDSKNELFLGDLNTDTLENIYSGRTRSELLERLEKKEFMAIGGPCRTVNCCQKVYYDGTDIKFMLKLRFPGVYTWLKRCKYSFAGASTKK